LGLEIVFNTQKIYLKKNSIRLIKKIKSTFKDLKSLKMTKKKKIDKNLKMKLCSKALFNLKILHIKRNPKQVLRVRL
jgi:hypothetical protein